MTETSSASARWAACVHVYNARAQPHFDSDCSRPEVSNTCVCLAALHSSLERVARSAATLSRCSPVLALKNGTTFSTVS